jgi:predicted ATPase/class 3 adenylate cyclase
VENPADARSCINCGTVLVARCLHCGGELPGAARFCPFCGQVVAGKGVSARPGPSKGGTEHTERRQVTVLFADFAGFTAFADKHDVEEVHEYLTSIWSRLDEVLLAHGGRVEKHIGDAVMAVFGAEHAREEDPVQAVRAGLAMQACLSQWAPPGPQPALQMRVGIHTGLVIVGPLGSSGEFVATGDTVNLASRLEQMAPVGTVLVSHDTYRQVYGFFDVQGLEPASVKGKTEPVRAYAVLKAKPLGLAMQLRGVEGVQTPMIGRRSELERLEALLQGVIAGRQARTLTILGEAGIGKSCLLREFQEWIELLPQNIRLFWGRARAETTGLPFALVRDMFSARFAIQESDPPALAREKLEQGLLELLGRAALAETTGHEGALVQIHFIGQLLGFDYSDSPFLKEILRDSDQVRARAFHHLGRFFQAVSSSPTPAGSGQVHAMLIVAEDAHWSDDGSLDFFEYLARTCPDAPLLMICLARPALLERRPGWGEGLPGHARLELGPLSRDESRALVESILRKAPAVPQALRELIVGSAEGIPFYIEEIINMLIDQKVIRPGPDQWEIEPTLLAVVRVPPTLAGILQVRLDGLTQSERRVLQCASVIGRVFWDSAVDQLCCSPDDALEGMPTDGHAVRAGTLSALSGLRSKGVIVRREGSAFAGAVEYSFRHELLRNVAYESLLKKSRRKHHARAAAWLIGRSGSRVEEVSGLVALHFEQAGKQAEAADWFGRAGQQARRSYAPALAIDYYRKGLALLPAAPLPADQLQAKQLEWSEGLIEVLGAQARFDEALEVCSKLQVLAETLSDSMCQARAWVAAAFLQERLGKNRASIECADRAEAFARQAGAAGQPELIKALHLKGWAYYRLGDAPAVLALADQTRRICTESGNRLGLATTCKLYGVAHLQLGHFEQADKFFQEGLALCEQSGDRRNAAAMFSNLGESARSRGDYEAAAELYEKALGIARQIGHRESEIIYLTNLGGARLGLGQVKPAEAELREAIALAGPKFCSLAETYSLLGQACLGQDKLPEAFEAARHALALAQEAENDLNIGLAWRTLGLVTAASGATGGPTLNGAPADPRACFAQSLRVLEAIRAEGEQAHTLRAWADFELRHGSAEEGCRKSEAARVLFARLGAEAEAARLDSPPDRMQR